MIKPIQSTKNIFDGRVIEIDSLSREPEEFARQLAASIAEWREEGIKVVWLDLSHELSRLIPIATEQGFYFYSVAGDRLRMTFKLEEAAFIPPAATHYVGAGGVVIRNDTDLLVVCERYRRGGSRHIKLPGGTLHPGEHIVDAVRREISEETGIETRFRSLVCFRHWHGYRDDKSDIYFVCRLDPLTFEISRQDDEIEDCFWMPLSEYLAHDEVHAFNRRVVNAALANGGIVHDTLEGYGTPETHELFMPPI